MSDDHYYIAGYSAEDDPYSEANGVLKNKLGITNTKDLNEVEAELAALAVQELLQESLLLNIQWIAFKQSTEKYFKKFIRGLESSER